MTNNRVRELAVNAFEIFPKVFATVTWNREGFLRKSKPQNGGAGQLKSPSSTDPSASLIFNKIIHRSGGE